MSHFLRKSMPGSSSNLLLFSFVLCFAHVIIQIITLLTREWYVGELRVSDTSSSSTFPSPSTRSVYGIYDMCFNDLCSPTLFESIPPEILGGTCSRDDARLLQARLALIRRLIYAALAFSVATWFLLLLTLLTRHHPRRRGGVGSGCFWGVFSFSRSKRKKRSTTTSHGMHMYPALGSAPFALSGDTPSSTSFAGFGGSAQFWCIFLILLFQIICLALQCAVTGHYVDGATHLWFCDEGLCPLMLGYYFLYAPQNANNNNVSSCTSRFGASSVLYFCSAILPLTITIICAARLLALVRKNRSAIGKKEVYTQTSKSKGVGTSPEDFLFVTNALLSSSTSKSPFYSYETPPCGGCTSMSCERCLAYPRGEGDNGWPSGDKGLVAVETRLEGQGGSNLNPIVFVEERVARHRLHHDNDEHDGESRQPSYSYRPVMNTARAATMVDSSVTNRNDLRANPYAAASVAWPRYEKSSSNYEEGDAEAGVAESGDLASLHERFHNASLLRTTNVVPSAKNVNATSSRSLFFQQGQQGELVLGGKVGSATARRSDGFEMYALAETAGNAQKMKEEKGGRRGGVEVRSPSVGSSGSYSYRVANGATTIGNGTVIGSRLPSPYKNNTTNSNANNNLPRNNTTSAPFSGERNGSPSLPHPSPSSSSVVDDWEWDENSGMYWSESQLLFLNPENGHFYDPSSDYWYDVDKEKWYPSDEHAADEQDEEEVAGLN